MDVNGYFAASNSGRGFCNYYPRVFGGAQHIYVIKGGPGTGKSRFMREVSDYSAGRGWECEYYYCSSDPTSLDGILLKKDGVVLAVIDGTPPHAWEPEFPGVREDIVNLGDFWNVDVLAARRSELEALNRRKADCWRRAYKWLEGCLDMCDIVSNIGERLLKQEEVDQVAAAMLSGVPQGDGYAEEVALIDSVGMKGRAASGEFYRQARAVFVIRDKYMTAHRLLRAMVDQAKQKGQRVTLSYDPIDPRRLDGVLLKDVSLAAVVSEDSPELPHEVVYMSELCREADDDCDAESCRALSCYDSMLAGAVAALGDVSKYHFEVENIYVSAMDFEAKERFTAQFCEKIFK